MIDKQKYIELCETEKSIPIFSKDWWLDSVCGKNNWDVVLIEKGGSVVATLPFQIQQKYGLKYSTMPQLTQTLGPWIKYPKNQKYISKLSYEKKIFTELIEMLPSFDKINQNFHYSVLNWLPFYWKNFKQTTRYTYVIESLGNLDDVFFNFSSAKKKNIKKSSEMIRVKFDLAPDDFYNNHKMTLAKQNSKISYSRELFKDLYKSVYRNNSGKTIYAIDHDGNIHSSLFVIWDDNSAYNLISTIDPDYRNSGSASLLVWEIIKFVSNHTKKFDFEGSMIEFVENSFRQFGAIQKPYFNISKTSRKMDIILSSKNILKSISGKNL